MNTQPYIYIACKSAGWGETALPCVFGMTVDEEYTETLDSATVIIPNLPESQRLTDLEPYQECRLSTGVMSAKYMLIDTFQETMTNVRDGGKYYTYTIELMSETKLLEKIQLPNVCVTQSRVASATQKTIYDVIVDWFEFYCPRIKKQTSSGWEFAYSLSMDEQALEDKFGSTVCAEMTLSQPTLRQALTSLMSQVGCIPVVKNRTLTYLDFRATQKVFDTDNAGITQTYRSMASDSYVNTLVNMGDNVIDYEGAAVSEALCFRDRNNVLLQQTSNLKLETRFPIYKVNSLKMRVLGANTTISFLYYGDTDLSAQYSYYVANNVRTWMSAPDQLSIYDYGNPETNLPNLDQLGVWIVSVKVSATGRWTVLKSQYVRLYNSYYHPEQTDTFTPVYDSASGWYGTTIDLSSYEDSSADFAIVEGYWGFVEKTTDSESLNYVTSYTDPDGNTVTMTGNMLRLIVSDNTPIPGVPTSTGIFHKFFNVTASGSNPGTMVVESYTSKMEYEVDITPLCVESTKRSLLNTDFLSLPSSFSSIDDMAEWLYCTVGYTVGDTSISGFSDTYTVTQGIWTNTYPHIENIWNAIVASKIVTDDYREELFGFDGAFDPLTGGEMLGDLVEAIVLDSTFWNDTYKNNFALFFFDIEYIPMLGGALTFRKEDTDYPLEQLDSKSDSLTSLGQLALNEQDSVNRFANDALAVHARVTDADNIQPLNSLLTIDGEEYTVYKRNITVNAHAVDVVYYASKDYVVKNYFTSVVTKYRAYEYVDYSSSVLRKDKVAVTLYVTSDADKAVNATERLNLSQSGLESHAWTYFLDAYDPLGEGIVYSVQHKTNYYKDEVAKASTDSSLIYAFQDFDNASQGIYVDGTYLDPDGNYASDPLGGIPQKYYAYEETLNGLFLTSDVNFYDRDDIEAYTYGVQAYPLVPSSHFGQIATKLEILRNGSSFSFTKDQTERWGLTLQLNFMTDGTCAFSPWMWRCSTFGGEDLPSVGLAYTFSWRFVTNPTSSELRTDRYVSYDTGIEADGTIAFGDAVSSSDPRSYISVNWDKFDSSVTSVKLVLKDDEAHYITYDFAWFRKPDGWTSGSVRYYIVANDLTGWGVYSESSNGLLCDRYTLTPSGIVER